MLQLSGFTRLTSDGHQTAAEYKFSLIHKGLGYTNICCYHYLWNRSKFTLTIFVLSIDRLCISESQLGSRDSAGAFDVGYTDPRHIQRL